MFLTMPSKLSANSTKPNQNGSKQSKTTQRARNGAKWLKMIQNGHRKWSQNQQNGTEIIQKLVKFLKMPSTLPANSTNLAQNGSKRSKITQMHQNGSKYLKIAQNGYKRAQNGPQMDQMGFKITKIASKLFKSC